MLRTFVVIYAMVFLAVGLLGFITHGSGHEPSQLLGIFPVNGLHNLAHLIIGAAGLIAAAVSLAACRTYCRIVGTLYLLLGVLGLLSPSGLGLMPIGGADIPLHLAAGGLALAFGLGASPARRGGAGELGSALRAGR